MGIKRSPNELKSRPRQFRGHSNKNPESVDPKTAKRVWKAVDELGYLPNTNARTLVSGRSRILGLIVSDITNPFFPELIKGLEDVGIREGYEILVDSTNYDSREWRCAYGGCWSAANGRCRNHDLGA